MELENGEKSQSKNIYRRENQGNTGSDSNGGEIFGSTGTSFKPKPIRVDRAICAGSNPINRRESISGGILRQLIEQARDQVATHIREAERLNKSIAEWESLLAELERRISENPFDGN
ncbi:hypothetical protein [Floridanema aerugineum]|jgi:hypothetical protein|uniref:Uncharacterized protein n=1 Tax=Floridaenema aerugineum BLCC-F46 TaxID=3153654 RepID=A0ABV4X3A2_9CYAN